MNFKIVKAKIFKMEFKKIVKYDQKKFFWSPEFQKKQFLIKVCNWALFVLLIKEESGKIICIYIYIYIFIMVL